MESMEETVNSVILDSIRSILIEGRMIISVWNVSMIIVMFVITPDIPTNGSESAKPAQRTTLSTSEIEDAKKYQSHHAPDTNISTKMLH